MKKPIVLIIAVLCFYMMCFGTAAHAEGQAPLALSMSMTDRAVSRTDNAQSVKSTSTTKTTKTKKTSKTKLFIFDESVFEIDKDLITEIDENGFGYIDLALPDGFVLLQSRSDFSFEKLSSENSLTLRKSLLSSFSGYFSDVKTSKLSRLTVNGIAVYRSKAKLIDAIKGPYSGSYYLDMSFYMINEQLYTVFFLCNTKVYKEQSPVYLKVLKTLSIKEPEELTEIIEQTEKSTTAAKNKPKNANAASVTTGERNALAKANSYLRYASFSYKGLIDQLKYSGYTDVEAKYGADNCGADWNEQALGKAKSYLKSSHFSKKGLIEQLEYSQFTNAQAVYAVGKCGADWKEQAVKKASSYLRHSSFSRQSLIAQLEYSGFTYEEAVYGAEQNGY